MNPVTAAQSALCHCTRLRQAPSSVSQLYDGHLDGPGLRGTQYAILAALQRLGPTTINALAQDMVMDRTTLGRNIVPLQRRRLIVASKGRDDGRSKELRLTKTGLARLQAGGGGMGQAQAQIQATPRRGPATQPRELLPAGGGGAFRTPID